MRQSLCWVGLCAVVLLGCEDRREPPVPPTPEQEPATLPATLPATRPVEEAEAEPVTFLELAATIEPGYEGLEPGRLRDVPEAASIVIDTPLHLCPRGDLWVTRPNARPLGEVLAGAANRQLHVVPIKVAGVFWQPHEGVFRPLLYERTGDGYTLHAADGPLGAIEFPHDLRFADAVAFNDFHLVPFASGVAVVRPGSLGIDALELDGDQPDLPPPAILRQGDGFVAWRRGGGDVAQWSPEAGWSVTQNPEAIVQLIPMRDGSTLHLVLDDNGEAATRSIAAVAAEPVDEAELTRLALAMADPSAEVRNAAYRQLQEFGPAAAPVLEELQARVPPEARVRIRSLLRSTGQPLLGDMRVLPGPIKIVGRLAHGGAVLHLPNGVMMPLDRGQPGERHMIPAWLSVRPGVSIDRLPFHMTAGLDSADPSNRFAAVGPEWVVSTKMRGPMRWYGNHLRELLPPERRGFGVFVGIDARGRWLFRETEGTQSPTLVIDPRLPLLDPDMPVWALPVEGGTVGRSLAGWPVMTAGGSWALKETGWSVLDDTRPEDAVFHRPMTLPEDAIGTGPSGTWYGGQTELRVVNDDGETVHTLPDAATGTLDHPRVFELPGEPKRLALVNEPGRVVRLRLNDDGELVEDGIFTRGVPNLTTPDQLWLDPAGRLVWAFDGNQLVIAFPTGDVPMSIMNMMPGDALR
jgi:hypothetical protein